MGAVGFGYLAIFSVDILKAWKMGGTWRSGVPTEAEAFVPLAFLLFLGGCLLTVPEIVNRLQQASTRPNVELKPDASGNESENDMVLTDIQMPFKRMVIFMVKWSLASIPAAIILLIIFAIFGALFGGILGSLL